MNRTSILLLSLSPWFSAYAQESPPSEAAEPAPGDDVVITLEVSKSPQDKGLSKGDLDILRQEVATRLRGVIVTEEEDALVHVSVTGERKDRKDRFGRNYTSLDLQLVAKGSLGDSLHREDVRIKARTLGRREAAFRKALGHPSFAAAVGKIQKAFHRLPALVVFHTPAVSPGDYKLWRSELSAQLNGARVESVALPDSSDDAKTDPSFALKVFAGWEAIHTALTRMVAIEYSWRGLEPASDSVTSPRPDRFVVRPSFLLETEFVLPAQAKGFDLATEEFLVQTLGQGHVSAVAPAEVSAQALVFQLRVHWSGRPLRLIWTIKRFLQSRHPKLHVDAEPTPAGIRFVAGRAYRVAFYLPTSDAARIAELEKRLSAIAANGNVEHLGPIERRGFSDAFRLLLKHGESWSQLRAKIEAACRAALLDEKLPCEFRIVTPPNPGEYAVACEYKVQVRIRGGKSARHLRRDLLQSLRSIVPHDKLRAAAAKDGGDSADNFGFVVPWPREPDDLMFRFLTALGTTAPDLEGKYSRTDSGYLLTLTPRRTVILGVSLPRGEVSAVECLQREIAGLKEVSRCDLHSSRRWLVPELTLDLDYNGQVGSLTRAASEAIKKCFSKSDGVDVRYRSIGNLMHFSVNPWQELRMAVTGEPELRRKASRGLVAELSRVEGVSSVQPVSTPGKESYQVRTSLSAGRLAIAATAALTANLDGTGFVDFTYDQAQRLVGLRVRREVELTACFELSGEIASSKVELLRTIGNVPGLQVLSEIEVESEKVGRRDLLSAGRVCVKLQSTRDPIDFAAAVRAALLRFAGDGFEVRHRKLDSGHSFRVVNRDRFQLEINGLPVESGKKVFDWIRGMPGLRSREATRLSRGKLKANLIFDGGAAAFAESAVDNMRRLIPGRELEYRLSASHVVFDIGARRSANNPMEAQDVAAATRLIGRFREAMILLESDNTRRTHEAARNVALLVQQSNGEGLAICPAAPFKEDPRRLVHGLLGGTADVYLSLLRETGVSGMVYAAVRSCPPDARGFPIDADPKSRPVAEVIARGSGIELRRPASRAAAAQEDKASRSEDGTPPDGFVLSRQGLVGIRNALGSVGQVVKDLLLRHE